MAFTNIETWGPARDDGPQRGLLAILDSMFVREKESSGHFYIHFCLWNANQ